MSPVLGRSSVIEYGRADDRTHEAIQESKTPLISDGVRWRGTKVNALSAFTLVRLADETFHDTQEDPRGEGLGEELARAEAEGLRGGVFFGGGED